MPINESKLSYITSYIRKKITDAVTARLVHFIHSIYYDIWFFNVGLAVNILTILFLHKSHSGNFHEISRIHSQL